MASGWNETNVVYDENKTRTESERVDGKIGEEIVSVPCGFTCGTGRWRWCWWRQRWYTQRWCDRWTKLMERVQVEAAAAYVKVVQGTQVYLKVTYRWSI